MTWFSHTWFNLKNMVALKAMWFNLRTDPLQWFLNELSPSSYTNLDHKLHWHNMPPEMRGWFLQHMPIGFAVQLVWILLCHFFPNILNIWMGLVLMAVIAFVIEVIQFFVAKASFINPINSAIDIAFYVAGSALAWHLSSLLIK
jgi:hypothetical protein